MPRQGLSRNGTLEAESEAEPSGQPSPESSPKQVVFRSKDAELRLVKTAGWTDKSRGHSEYHPSTGVQFMDFFLRLDDITANQKLIKWLRGHPSNGISFREVPDIRENEALPPIAELKAMTLKELRELCGRRKMETPDESATKDSVILALLEGSMAT